MSSAQPSATGAAPTPLRLTLRLLLALGVALSVVGAVCLVIILGVYFTGGEPAPALYAVVLVGIPAGFLLMVAHMVSLSAWSRHARRRRHV
ncbi:hypothetical protein [Nesterenkonia sp. F]|uniref:hypothetical protein n=1 Tax=Nesterenkonia sp. F TaxID=795955 RepID=UPI000255D563|nr:hypothetical protein [Nesterenkonia sp. F]